MPRFFAPRKPRKCPACGAKPVASILYGLPDFSLELRIKIDKGTVAIGGCEQEIGAPMWHCSFCETDIYHERDRAWIESGGYDNPQNFE